ncbi:MAG: ATP-binding cassette domain-containing protein [Actinobacteria bacterium]|nr:ATP-binding cassette domain-containing protein [Actinomycetota bacterium]
MHGQWMALRSMSSDQSVKNQKLKAGTLKRIFSFALPYRKFLTIFIGTVVIDAVLVVATPLLLRSLVDDGVVPGRPEVVTRLALIVAALAIADAAFSMLGRWFSSRIGEGLIYDLRSQVFEHVQKQSIAFFTRTQTGSLISRINSDVIGAQQAFTSTLSGIVSNSLTLLLVVIAMLTLSWQITLVSLILLPVFIIPTKWIGRQLANYTRQSFDLNAEMSSTMTERFNVSGALLVSLYGDRISEGKNFRGKARRVADMGIKIAMLNRVFFIAMTSVAAIATSFAYGIGGHLAINREITIGTLLAITALLARLYGPLTSLSNIRVDVMSALVSFERVFEVLDLKPMVTDPAIPIPIPKTMPTIEFSKVSFTYPKANEISIASLEGASVGETNENESVLAGVSFICKPGTLTAIVGPSGAGKSTISGLLPRLYDVTEGSISINGVDVRDTTILELRSLIGIVTQDSHMLHESIAENLRYAKVDATEIEMWAACDSAQIGEFIRTLPNGLDTVVGERGHRLSGGEKQRLAIARLLLKKPQIVVLDEATAHLDSENEALVQNALATALSGRTSIVIAHRLSTIVHADQILVLENGRIVESGKHDELVAKGGLYFDLYQRQSLGFTEQ